MPDPTRQLEQEAAIQFLDLLLLCKKESGRSWEEFCEPLGITRRTIQRWQGSFCIPTSKAVSISRVLKFSLPATTRTRPLSGPADFDKTLFKAQSCHAAIKCAHERTVVGYAAVWLSSRFPREENITAEVNIGDDSVAVARVVKKGREGNPIAHIDFLVRNQKLYYQACKHVAGVTVSIQFEGRADSEAFDFCYEFLTQCRDKAIKSTDLKAKIRRTLSRHYERTRKSQHARPR